jgi:hypothetical protein
MSDYRETIRLMIELSIYEKFRQKYSAIDNGCWRWNGALDKDGYGDFWYIIGKDIRRNFAAHRASWELFKYEIPEGLSVLHKCDNPWCVNPEHLFLGTQLDNIRDRDSKNRWTPRYGEINPMSKLKSFQVSEIKRLLSIGKRNLDVARKFNISPQTVCGIKKNRSWRQVI